jgi:hypothetical protein
MIWIIGMNDGKKVEDKLDFQNPRALDAINRFLECTGGEFDCSKIAGQKFEDIGAHADYLRAGDCSKIFEPLAMH